MAHRVKVGGCDARGDKVPAVPLHRGWEGEEKAAGLDCAHGDGGYWLSIKQQPDEEVFGQDGQGWANLQRFLRGRDGGSVELRSSQRLSLVQTGLPTSCLQHAKHKVLCRKHMMLLFGHHHSPASYYEEKEL